MLEFYKTGGGRRFCDTTMPELVRELNRVADAMEKANQLKERELKIREADMLPLKTISDEFVEGKKETGTLAGGMNFDPDKLITKSTIEREKAIQDFVEKVLEDLERSGSTVIKKVPGSGGDAAFLMLRDSRVRDQLHLHRIDIAYDEDDDDYTLTQM